jgi:hypothetical protein
MSLDGTIAWVPDVFYVKNNKIDNDSLTTKWHLTLFVVLKCQSTEIVPKNLVSEIIPSLTFAEIKLAG